MKAAPVLEARRPARGRTAAPKQAAAGGKPVFPGPPRLRFAEPGGERKLMPKRERASMSAGPARPGSVPVRDAPGETGVLYVVATPIGNLADLGERARAVLGAVDVVIAEDTRHTRRLLRRHGIAARLESFHEHNERRRTSGIVARLAAGESFALVSDAGTPLVNDPGYGLVRGAVQANVPVVPIPGPSAFLCALSVAGLPMERFAFEGFLPSARGARSARLEALADDPRTLVFHEAPHRVVACLGAMREAFGGARTVVVARELTKRHESIVRTTLDEAVHRVGEPRGEYVILVAGRERTREVPAAAERTLEVLLEALPLRQAVDLAARATGVARKPLYRLALARRGERDEDGRAVADGPGGGGVGGGGCQEPGRGGHYPGGSRPGSRCAAFRGGEESPGSTGQGAR